MPIINAVLDHWDALRSYLTIARAISSNLDHSAFHNQ